MPTSCGREFSFCFYFAPQVPLLQEVPAKCLGIKLKTQLSISLRTLLHQISHLDLQALLLRGHNALCLQTWTDLLYLEDTLPPPPSSCHVLFPPPLISVSQGEVSLPPPPSALQSTAMQCNKALQEAHHDLLISKSTDLHSTSIPFLSPANPSLCGPRLFQNHLPCTFWGFCICFCSFLFKKTLHFKTASGITQNRNVPFQMLRHLRGHCVSGKNLTLREKRQENICATQGGGRTSQI